VSTFTLTPLGQQLLHSIPRKVYLWLLNLGVDLSAPGAVGRLCWRFNEAAKAATITYNPVGEATVTLTWNMDLSDPTGTTLVSASLEGRLEDNLSWFIALERGIYAELEDLEAAMAKRAAPQPSSQAAAG
jgi:hypothetical protein